MGDRDVRTPGRWPLLIFALAALGLSVAALFLHRSMRDGAHRRGAAELEAVAARKVSAIADWRRETEDDAAFVAAYPSLARVAATAGGRAGDGTLAHASEVLTSVAARHGYERFALLAPDGRMILEVGRRAAPSVPYDPELVARAAADGPGVPSALSARPDDGAPRLDVAARVRDGTGGVVGILYVRHLAPGFLASIMGTWPVPSVTGETVIVRRDGDAALFVTDPRFLSGWALRRRIPLTERTRGVVRAALGEEGVFPAVDFRGTPMLVASRHVPGSDWFVLTRMDLSEIEAPVLQPARIVGALLLALLAACAVALLAWWRRERSQHRALAAAQAALADSQERLELALAGTHHVWDWDLATGRLHVDPHWAAAMGASAADGAGSPGAILAHLAHPDDLPEVLSRFEAHARGEAPVFEAEFRTVHPSGDIRWVLVRGRASRRDAAGRALRVTGVVSDVTDRRHLQAQLERTERMASLGTLAAGVAHEVNNPLAYVLESLEFASRELAAAGPVQPELSEALAHARDGAARVRDVVRGLKAFSRPGSGRRAPADVGAELESALRLAGNEIRHRARLDLRIGPTPRVASGDHELGQVFLNLLLNAAQAIPDGGGSGQVISVEAGTDPAGWARVEVRDTGAGIPPQILPRIFEPFFTTKRQGVGTGLGLAIAHGIVQAAGGRIEVESQVGRGSLFRVLLPPAPAPAAARETEAGAARVEPAAGRPRVLVVDDDPLVARSIVRGLGPSHDVTTTTTAADALERLERGDAFDVLLCDLMMPGMTGMELHERVAARDPALAARFVFVTGGAFTSKAREFLDRSTNPCVEKPFDLSQLRAVVARTARGPAGVRPASAPAPGGAPAAPR